MALSNKDLQRLKEELTKASNSFGSNELIFESEWIYLLPSQALVISGKMLHQNYDIPDDYGKSDLEKLEKMGFLKKIYQSEEDPVTLEQTTKYEIIKKDSQGST